MKLKQLFASALLLSLFSFGGAFGLQWQTDYDQAMSQAKAESKPVLLFFTGSDWCTWCKKLEKEAFNTAEFDREMGNRLIFVELDYPRSSNQDQKLRQQNQKLAQKYGIRGYPTVILLSSDGQLLGRTGYQAGGGQNYANHLLQMIR